MVTFDEELARAFTEAKVDETGEKTVEGVCDWYAIEICTACASEDVDIEVLIERLRSHWEDFEDVTSSEVYPIQSQKHREHSDEY